MTKLFLRNLFLVAAYIFSSHANAASYQGTISNISVYLNKIYMVVTNGTFDGTPSTCGTTANMVFWFDPATSAGKAALALAITAKTTGRLVYVIGDGVCVGGSIYLNSGMSEGLLGLDFKG